MDRNEIGASCKGDLKGYIKGWDKIRLVGGY